jgi:hypothetical protein
MARLSKERTFVFRENSVTVPSNIGDLVRIDFDEGKISLKYLELLVALYAIQAITKEKLKEVAERALESIRDLVAENRLSASDFKWAQGYVGKEVRGLK